MVDGAARARAGRAHARSPRSTCGASLTCARSSRGCGSAGRCRASGATTRSRRCTRSPRSPALAYCAARLPGRAAGHIARGPLRRADGHWRLVTPALVRGGARRRRRALRVDGRRRRRGSAALEALGVDGVITNDPRLFAQADRAGRGASSRPGRRRRSSGAPALGELDAPPDRVRRSRQRKRTTPRSDAPGPRRREVEAPAGLDGARPWRAELPPAGVGVASRRASCRRRVAVLDLEAHQSARTRAASPASRRGCRSSFGCLAVSQTLTVAHSVGRRRRGAARRRRRERRRKRRARSPHR